MANYVNAGTLKIRPLLQTGEPAIDRARKFYAQHSGLDFIADFTDYCRNGYVVIRPDLFGMVKPHRLDDGSNAWHIQFVIGNLVELLSTLPCKLEWITFCRDNKADQMKKVRWNRFERLARIMSKKHSGRQGN